MLSIKEELQLKRIYHFHATWSYFNPKIFWKNPALSMNLIKKIIKDGIIPVSYKSLCKNPNIDIAFIKEAYAAGNTLDWKELSGSTNRLFCCSTGTSVGFSMDDIIANKDLPWVWHWVSFHPELDFHKHVLKNPDLPWDYHGISRTIKDISVVEEYPNYPWDYQALSYNDYALSLDYVLAHKNKKWDTCGLSVNKKVISSIQTALDNPKQVFDVKWLLFNPAISYEDIMNHASLFGHAIEYAVKKAGSLEQVMNDVRLTKMITPRIISSQASDAPWLTLKDVYHYKTNNWNWQHVFSKVDMSLDEAHQLLKQEVSMTFHDVYAMYLCCNPSIIIVKEHEVVLHAKQIMASWKIKYSWHRAICNPGYTMCRNRLMKEYADTIASDCLA